MLRISQLYPRFISFYYGGESFILNPYECPNHPKQNILLKKVINYVR